MKIDKIWGIMIAILFIVYNFCVFLIGGFTGHTGTFWASYVMELISMFCIFAMSFRVTAIGEGKKLLFLGYSVFFWSTIFGTVQFVLTTIFMILDKGIKFALSTEVVLLAVYIILILICFKNQEMIQEIQKERTVSIDTMKTLKLQLGIITELSADIDLKRVVEKLKEEFEYSDSVSSVETEDIEQQMLDKVNLLKIVCRTNAEQAIELCNELKLQLKERNLICQSAKKRF